MVRGKSDAPARLQEAAMALFAERGYDEVTVTEIAGRAGMTKRSFFNHFADKPEVMFASADALQARVLAALTEADGDRGPLDTAVHAFTQAAAAVEDYPELARARRAIIGSSPDLQERDLAKMAALTTAVAGALAGRGVPRRDAVFVAQAATTVFTTAVDEWASDPGRGLAASIQAALRDLRAAVAAGARDMSLPGRPSA
jgi:AcrR family transcriptional regulator